MIIKKVKIEIKGKEIEIDNKMQRSHLIELLGEADEIGGFSRKIKSGQILKYDETEFHFCNDRGGAALYLVYSETKEGYCKIAIPLN
jgi:hypothetical protein